MVRLIAPNGYKLKDNRTDTLHSEVVTDEKNRKYFELVPDDSDEIVEYTEY